MSTIRRVISGTAASWARIVITLLTQVLLVPVYLRYWSIQEYGIWIVIQAMVHMIGMLDRGFVDFLGYEFLILNKNQNKKIVYYLWSGFITILLTGIIELIIIFLFSNSSYFILLIGDEKNINNKLLNEASIALISQWIGWAFCANTTGLFFRALTVYGYYARMAWWDVLVALLTSIVTGLVIVNGGSLIDVGIWTNAFIVILTIPRVIDINNLMNDEKFKLKCFSIRKGISLYKISINLSIKYILDNLRQQGIRLILSPILGVTSLAAFTTMRTGANIVQQGLLTVTNPMLPELMGFINKKEYNKIKASIGSIWFILVVVLCPIVLCLQLVMPSIFSRWTNNQIEYDPILFFLLSLTILIYALAQPAMAIVIGNNLIKIQNIIAILSSVILITSSFIFIPLSGIRGVGLSLVIAEISSTILFTYYLKVWLKKLEINWPNKLYFISILSVIFTSIAIILIIYNKNISWIIFLLSLLVLIFIAIIFIKSLPTIIKDRFRNSVNANFFTNVF